MNMSDENSCTEIIEVPAGDAAADLIEIRLLDRIETIRVKASSG
ncbi:hypothetical protein [Streptomyces sp. RKAG293]|nr:hypothetical protein [Streptomyces sp. RKAG293]